MGVPVLGWLGSWLAWDKMQRQTVAPPRELRRPPGTAESRPRDPESRGRAAESGCPSLSRDRSALAERIGLRRAGGLSTEQYLEARKGEFSVGDVLRLPCFPIVSAGIESPGQAARSALRELWVSRSFGGNCECPDLCPPKLWVSRSRPLPVSSPWAAFAARRILLHSKRIRTTSEGKTVLTGGLWVSRSSLIELAQRIGQQWMKGQGFAASVS